MRRSGTLEGWLARVGFDDPTRCSRLVTSGVMEALVSRAAERHVDVVTELGATADPDLALLALVKLAEGAPEEVREEIVAALGSDAAMRRRLFAVAGASEALGSWFAAHPDQVSLLAEDEIGRAHV